MARGSFPVCPSWLCWTLIFTVRIFHTLWIIRTNTSHFGMCDIYVRPILILIGTSFSQMSNFRRVKNSHVFVTPVKNSFKIFTPVTSTCELFTRVTDSSECGSQTNLSHMWKIRTYLSHLWRIRANFSQMWQIRTIPSLCKGLANIFHICNTFAWHQW